MKLRQTQLMLIIDNMNVPLPGKATVYQDVMDAWTRSMVMLDKLVSGVPQSVESGEALLGLCAWHIYPDICALGKTTTLVEHQDTLVKKGGLVTIGLRNARSEADAGISWSMPLEHLRYYGKAVMTHGTVSSQKSRVAFDRILQVAMGSMLSTWGSHYSNLDDVAQFLIAFGHMLRGQDQTKEQLDWPTLFSEQAKIYIHSDHSEQTEIARYIALGQRRYEIFLAHADHHPPPCLGLSDLEFFLQFQKPEEGIATLRSVAQKSGDASLDGAIIKLVHAIEHGMVEYASLVPQSIPGSKEKRHRRWLILPAFGHEDIPQSGLPRGTDVALMENQSKLRHSLSLDREHAIIRRSLVIMGLLGEPCGFLDVRTMKQPSTPLAGTFFWSDKTAPRSLEYLVKRSSKPGAETVDDIETAKRRYRGWQMGHLDHVYKNTDYSFLLGNVANLAVYVPVSISQGDFGHKLPIEFITRSILSGRMDSNKFCKYFESKTLHNRIVPGKVVDHDTRDSWESVSMFKNAGGSVPTTGTYFESLIALARAREVYVNLPEAEVDLNVVSIPLWSTKWATAALFHDHQVLTRAVSFACVAMFDTGYLDLDLEAFDEVIAISSANTIYASEILFCDPWRLSTHALRHVTGNVGKPGLALLLSPKDTMLREPNLETREQVNHAKYDGKCEDNFAATSLHLNLTGYEQPLNLGRHGGRDKEAFYVEAVISVHDYGAWVADLNLLHFARESSKAKLKCSAFDYLPASCEHDTDAKRNTSGFTNLTSIDNWYEFLDGPRNAGIVRARGNWVARLALAATPVTKDQNLVVALEDICWACVRHIIEMRGNWSADKLLVLC